jgi:hypothetical protein
MELSIAGNYPYQLNISMNAALVSPNTNINIQNTTDKTINPMATPADTHAQTFAFLLAAIAPDKSP